MMSDSQPDTVPIRDARKTTQEADLVEIPENRRYHSGTEGSLRGVPLALTVSVVGCAGIGAGYGAFVALCGETLVNVAVACSFPFWMNVPSQVGLMWGHLRDERWRNRIELIGYLVCLYAVPVGWLAAVPDGPGLILNPVQLSGFLMDTSIHGVWIEAVPLIDLTPELSVLAPWLLTIRLTECCWIALTGFLARGAAMPWPYCQTCRRWMQDSATLRVHYQPDSVNHVQRLAADLVAENYDGLLQLNDPVAPKAKGLEVSVYRCEGCSACHVMDIRWYRSAPDPKKSEVEQLLESATGIRVVSGLRIPGDVQTRLVALAGRKAA